MFRAFLFGVEMGRLGKIPVVRWIRWRMEAGVFSLALRLIPLLSRRTVLRIARLAGWLGWRVARRDRRIAMANLDLAYGTTLSPQEKHEIVRKVFSTFVLTGLDYFWFSRDRKERLAKWVVVDEPSSGWMNKSAQVAVTAHVGNWEILGWVMARHGAAIASVAKPVKNPLIDAEVNRLRTLSGQLIIPREGALRTLVRVLKGGGTVALLLDQDTVPAEGGVFVPFFDVPVPISTAAAGLALKLKVPIVMAFCVCDEQGVYHCYGRDRLMPEGISQMSPEEITARIAGYVESEIRRQPGYWLWTYKRWKRRLPDFDASRYPYYADC